MSFVSVVSRLQHLSPKSAALMLACGALSLGAVTLDAQAQAQTLPLAARAKGLKTAPVTVYEMADFQCPYCRQFAVETMPTIDKEYVKTGKVRWVFINLPLQSLHANAEAAAEFAACAGRENRFWQAHDMLYQAQADWENLPNPAAYFQSHFVSLGLKRDSMMQCLTSGAGAAMVKDDAAGAEKAGAHSTPTFYIEGGMMDGAQPIGIFRRVLDSIYTAKKKQH